MLEVDYFHKLTPEQQAFLLAFHEAEYGGNGKFLYEDQEEVRRLWRENKRQDRDAMNGAVHDVPLDTRVNTRVTEEAMIETLDLKAVEEEAEERAQAQKDAQEQRYKRRKGAVTLLKAYRRRTKLMYVELAAMLNVKPWTVTRVIRGVNLPSDELTEQIYSLLAGQEN